MNLQSDYYSNLKYCTIFQHDGIIELYPNNNEALKFISPIMKDDSMSNNRAKTDAMR